MVNWFVSEIGRVCDKHGPYRARRWVLPGDSSIESACPDCRDEMDAARRKTTREAALFDFRLKLAAAGIGSRYYGASFDNYRTTREEAVRTLAILRDYSEKFDPRRSPNLIMWGKTGYGKTHLACAVARSLILNGFTVTYLPVLTMFSQYQDIASYSNKNDDSREAFFARLRAPDLLILDEFGITSMTSKEQIVFHRVIDERYNRKAPICLVGNTDVFEFSQLIGERADRRVMADAEVLPFNWPSELPN
jgi:DNA replication protein DnaC